MNVIRRERKTKPRVHDGDDDDDDADDAGHVGINLANYDGCLCSRCMKSRRV